MCQLQERISREGNFLTTEESVFDVAELESGGETVEALGGKMTLSRNSAAKIAKPRQSELFVADRAQIAAKDCDGLAAEAHGHGAFAKTGCSQPISSHDSTASGSSSLAPPQSALITALTAAGATDICSLERFEVLGDSFLKFAVTWQAFCQRPAEREGLLSSRRSQRVCNHWLFLCARQRGLAGHVMATLFTPPPLPGYHLASLSAIVLKGT